MSQAPEPSHLSQRLDRTEARPYSLGQYARRAVWNLIQRTFVRYSPPRAARWRNFWLRCFGARLDSPSSTRPSTTITHPGLFTLGRYSMLADRVRVYNLGPIHVGSHTVVSQGAYLCAGSHDYTQPTLPLQRPPIHIGSGVWICTEAFIGPGVSIGDNSVVGARAVVVNDVPPNVVVAGNPARVVKQRRMRTSE